MRVGAHRHERGRHPVLVEPAPGYRNEHFAGSPFIPQAGWQDDYGVSGWSYGAVPPLTATGYPEGALLPGLCLGTLHLRNLQGHYPAGTYIVRWEGDAVFDAMMDDVQAVRRLSALPRRWGAVACVARVPGCCRCRCCR